MNCVNRKHIFKKALKSIGFGNPRSIRRGVFMRSLDRMAVCAFGTRCQVAFQAYQRIGTTTSHKFIRVEDSNVIR